MPLCEGCGSSYEDQFHFCPYCGRSKPKPNELVISIQDGSSLACPFCHLSNEVKKVPAIMEQETHRSESVTPVTHSYTGSDGKTHSDFDLQRTTTVEMSDLAKRLQPPKKPSLPWKPLDSPVIYFIVGTIVAVFIGLAMLVTFDPLGLVIAIGIFLAGLIGWRTGIGARETYPARLKEAQDRLARAEKAYENWGNLYYCYRDGRVFQPGHEDSTPVEKMMEFIFSY